jgi:hypothetical protein
MLVHLDKNKLALYGVGKDDLYDFMLNTARHAIVRWACREGGRPRPGLEGPDAEVAAMAAWIAAHSAAGKRGERQGHIQGARPGGRQAPFCGGGRGG